MHGVVPHTCNKYLPTGSRLNMVKKLATSYTRIGFTPRICATLFIADSDRKFPFWRCARSSSGSTALCL